MTDNNGYAGFAAVYDLFTDDEEYDRIAGFIKSAVKQYSLTPQQGQDKLIALDLACGTGKLCQRLCAAGFDTMGVDISEECLEIAIKRAGESALPIQYLLQDIREIDMFGTVDLITCTMDSLDHLPTPEDIHKVIERAAFFAQKGALFIFDMNTPYKHRSILADNTFVFEDEGLYCVWQNYFDEDSENYAVDILLDIFSENKKDGSYSRYSEEFTEIAVDEEIIKNYLASSGFELLSVNDGYSDKAPAPDTQRIVYTARKLYTQK